MAVPNQRHTAPHTDDAASPRRLFDHALGLLLDHLAGPVAAPCDWRFGPLVIVSAMEGAAATAILEAAAARGAALPDRNIVSWEGAALGREIGLAIAGDRLNRFALALASSRLVVVDRIDRVVGVERQRALVHLIDTSTAAGVAWCVSLAESPTDRLGPQCASRLSGGLVVPAPPTSRDTAVGTASPSFGRVIRAVARRLDVPVEAILGPSRCRTVVVARSLVMYVARRLTGMSFQAIGRACGGRDHTTVLHGVRTCRGRIARDPVFAAEVELLADHIAGARKMVPRNGCRLGVGLETLRGRGTTRRRRRQRTA